MTGQRGCYWMPGMNSAAEPWTALAECNTGHLIVPSGRNTAYAWWVVEHWRELTSVGLPVDPYRICVGAAVVDPAGTVTHSWGSVPAPGGPPRWTALWRLRDPATCKRCGAARWPGCWTARDLDGCSRCLPPAETADPRRWPLECAPPTWPEYARASANPETLFDDLDEENL